MIATKANMGVYIPDEVRGGVRETGSNSKALDLVADVGWIGTYEVLLWALALLLAAIGLVAVFTTGPKTISVLGLALLPAVFVLTVITWVDSGSKADWSLSDSI